MGAQGLARRLGRTGSGLSDTMGSRILALVGDCYGARGGIARYNQDLFDALADGSTDILILPRHGDASGQVLPLGVRQNPPIFGRLKFSLAAIVAAWLSAAGSCALACCALAAAIPRIALTT